jgi:hypothetical protein
MLLNEPSHGCYFLANCELIPLWFHHNYQPRGDIDKSCICLQVLGRWLPPGIYGELLIGCQLFVARYHAMKAML